MRKLAPVYDERAKQHQYDRCACGKVKAKQARTCKTCWDFERRKRDRAREWKKLPRGAGSPKKVENKC